MLLDMASRVYLARADMGRRMMGVGVGWNGRDPRRRNMLKSHGKRKQGLKHGQQTFELRSDGKEAGVDDRTRTILMAEEPPGAGGLRDEEIDWAMQVNQLPRQRTAARQPETRKQNRSGRSSICTARGGFSVRVDRMRGRLRHAESR